MTPVENFIYQKEGKQREILLYLHHYLVDQQLQAKIRYKIPFYYGKSWICYLNPIKNEGIELAFIRGNELSNADGLLDFKERKQVAGIAYYSTSEIDKIALETTLQEAILLDETVPYASKRR